MNQQIKTIYELNIGEQGIILDMEAIEKSIRHRFMDLGIAPYSKVSLIKRLNFNNLYIIEVDDVEICIRRKDAKLIKVKV